MLLLYCVYIYSLLNSDLLNKCKIFNIKDSECINSSFIPSSEYKAFLRNSPSPIIRDDNCTMNKCLPANTTNNIQPQMPQQPEVDTMTLTSTTTSTVVITIPKQTIYNNDDKNTENQNNGNSQRDDNKTKNCCECTGEKKCKTKEDDCDKCKSCDSSSTKCDKEITKTKETVTTTIDESSKKNKKQDVTTVIREIPTTVTVEVPLTLFREHTTTSISKVPVINYSLTTFTEQTTTTETFYKTSTITSEIYKTTTYTTEVLKTTTVEYNKEKTKKYDDEEDVKSVTKYDYNFKDVENDFFSKKREPEDKNVVTITKFPELISTVYITPGLTSEAEKITTVFVTTKPETIEKNEESTSLDITRTVFLTTTVSIPKKENLTTVFVTKTAVSTEKPQEFITSIIPIKDNISTVYITKSVVLPILPLDNTPTISPSAPFTLSKTISNIPKKKEDCDEDIILLIKELLRSNLSVPNSEYLKSKKNKRKVYKTVLNKKKKKKCPTKRACKGKKCQVEENDKLCDNETIL